MTMWLRALLLAGAAAAVCADALPGYSSDVAADARLDVPGLVRRYGYPLEEHEVMTRDGYVLTAHRIPHGRAPGSGPRPVVLLMHGLMCSSADFLVLGPGKALGYLLADAGYDVWLANARGNYYSRRHLFLDPNDREGLRFWMFSWDEIGNLDLPALVDHITAITGQRRMHFVGYSQGTTAFLVLNSLRPEFNQRFLSFQALAPAAFNEHTNNPLQAAMVQFENILERVAFDLGFGEIMGRNDQMTELGIRFCSDGSALQPLCTAAILGDVENFNATILPVLLGHNPAGAAVRQIIHYAQVQRFNRFARYNFDPVTNLARYGSIRPPEYDVARVTVPTFLHYGLGDANSYYKNVLLLAERMPGVAVLRQVPRRSFNHFDFIWGGDVKAQLYDSVIATMRGVDRGQP